MQRLKRRLSKLVCILSLFVCLSTIAVWAWSICFSPFGIVALRSGQLTLFNCGFGQLAMLRVTNAPNPDGIRWFEGYFLDGIFGLPSAPGAFSTNTTEPDWHVRFLGGEYLSGRQQYLVNGQHELICDSSLLVIPCWLVCVATGWPMWFVIRDIRRRFRRPPGFCSHCGYDLRATPDRCPECGTTRAAE
jgi:hypothetical protein